MPEPVRVRDNTTGHKYSTYAVDESGRVDAGLTKLSEPAVDANGVLLPPEYPAAPAVATVPEPTTGRTATTKES